MASLILISTHTMICISDMVIPSENGSKIMKSLDPLKNDFFWIFWKIYTPVTKGPAIPNTIPHQWLQFQWHLVALLLGPQTLTIIVPVAIIHMQNWWNVEIKWIFSFRKITKNIRKIMTQYSRKNSLEEPVLKVVYRPWIPWNNNRIKYFLISVVWYDV